MGKVIKMFPPDIKVDFPFGLSRDLENLPPEKRVGLVPAYRVIGAKREHMGWAKVERVDGQELKGVKAVLFNGPKGGPFTFSFDADE